MYVYIYILYTHVCDGYFIIYNLRHAPRKYDIIFTHNKYIVFFLFFVVFFSFCPWKKE